MADTNNRKNSSINRRKGGKENKWKKCSHLPNALKKELKSLNPTEDQQIQSDDVIDVYEYEETIPDEESKKNRWYDPVDNFEYQLPKDFQDEDVASDDDDDEEEEEKKEGSDDGKHVRITRYHWAMLLKARRRRRKTMM